MHHFCQFSKAAGGQNGDFQTFLDFEKTRAFWDLCCRASAGSTHILERFEIFWFDGSMVQCFHGSISKVTNQQVLSCRACFSLQSSHFVLFSCEFKICAEVVVHRMFAVFLNSLNGKNSSRTIVRDIFPVFF